MLTKPAAWRRWWDPALPEPARPERFHRSNGTNSGAPPGGTELEGLGGPGDSGGPVFVEVDGQLYLAAISSTLSHKGGGSSGVYGDRERGVRRLLGRLGRWRVGIRWYLFVLLLTPAIAMATEGSTPD